MKLRLYARAGIPEYWIVDATAGTLDIYRQPSGDRYADVLHAARGETIAPLAFSDTAISVDAIFA